MNHVPQTGPELARNYIRTFFQFQKLDGHLCSVIQPPLGADAHSCSTDASVPNVAITVLDNYQQDPDMHFLASIFPKLERYVQWDRQYGAPPPHWNPAIKYLLRWHNAGDVGMDHEQNFCPGAAYWHGPARCSADHYALDFANYLIWEAQALAKLAAELKLPARAAYWSSLAQNVTLEMDEYMWDDATGMHYDLFPSGSHTKDVPALYLEWMVDFIFIYEANSMTVTLSLRRRRTIVLTKLPYLDELLNPSSNLAAGTPDLTSVSNVFSSCFMASFIF